MVLDRCVSPLQLLEKKKRVQLKDMGEDLECLCQIMRTVGPRLDHEKAKVGFRLCYVHFYHLSQPINEEFCWLPASVVVFWVMMSYQALTQLLGSEPAGTSSPHPLLPCSPVFNGSVLCPYAILNEQQGVACQDPLPAARHGGAARKQLGPPQGFHRQRTKDDQPDPPGRREGVSAGGLRLRLGRWRRDSVLTSALLSALQDLGVFIPAPMSQGMRMDFFLENPFIPNRVKLDRETLGGLADMFGQMPGLLGRRHFVLRLVSLRHRQTSVLLLLRRWDRNRPGGHSGQVLAHDGPPSHQPALQRPRWPHCSSPAVAVRHGAKVLRQVQPGKRG